ncbi:excalibur calcium-binding domain-containing protein [Kineococcus rhizosphaerae]|uniref:LGFP repeat-containing protein n=1 Tax=Kineococcus rhizosphaerae TaxID=559628 RepID=A0A2T0QZQ5_9ACTN|nr:excalibur calcium-binding domain-containing protein [Kineococcus rhizosphaerae]PRY12178.1 LGFP repeat-containing protein [Kineococcus rhizosphaerae]
MRGRAVVAAAALLVGGTVATAGTASAAECLQQPVQARYDQLGGAAGKLGGTAGCEQPTATGSFATFRNGAIYFSPGSGAWDVSGSFRDLWASTGWENGFLHYPTSGENPAGAGGVYQQYQGGTLYWSPSTGAHSVSGAFAQLFGSLGWENGFLGYPTSQEVPIRGGVFQLFQGGVAYWSPATGAHTVSGSFRDLYGRFGFENGCLGYPATQELPSVASGVYQRFQGGTAYWSPTTGAHALCGDLLAAYGSTGYEGGSLGYPTSDEYAIAGGRRVDFQGGYVEWSSATGARVNQQIAAAPTPPVTTPPSTGVYYANCTAVWNAIGRPIRSGEPGYRPGLDSDHDGVGCENDPR